MSRLQWDRPQDIIYETGLDRGVLYLDTGEAVSWSGLSSVSDSGETVTKEFYIDGQKYLTMVSGRDWKGSMEAYTYPDEFSHVIGIPEIADGLYADSQIPSQFGLSYRTIVVSPEMDTVKHYKIHLIYQVMASLGEFTHNTLSETSDPIPFQFDLSAIPQRILGHRPTAHLIVDTRNIDAGTRASLEALIYGSDTINAVLPTPNDLLDMLSFGGSVTVVYNGDGTWTATGSNENVYMTDLSHFQLDQVNAEYLSSTVYKFIGLDSVDPAMTLFADSDAVPYYAIGEGTFNVGIDSDGVPYFLPGASSAVVSEDLEGPYYTLE